MAKPGRFGLQDPDALVGKARRELQRLNDVAAEWEGDPGQSDQDWYEKQVELQSDHAFNFSITAWHITDWFSWHVLDRVPYLTSAKKEKALADFQSYVRSRSPALAACYDLSRGAKHFEITRTAAQITGTDVVVRTGHDSSFSDDFSRRKVTLRVIDTGGTLRAVEDLFADALADINFPDWERYFRAAGYPV
jgi:hypothetical protein